jgi:hypothetical protein
MEAWDAANRQARKERQEREKEKNKKPEELPAPQPRPAEPGMADVTFDEGPTRPRWPAQVTITWNSPKPSTETGPTVDSPDEPLVPIQAAQYEVKDEPASSTDGKKEGAGFLINLDQSVELAVFNSREFQDRRESLYLTALPVTLERFNFLPQFFATDRFFREWAGRLSNNGKQNKWEFNTSTGPTSGLGFSQLFSTGALLTLQLANRTVINLTGSPRHTISESTLIMDLSQPLLQAGGPAVTLEPLTQSERDLVYELRNFARFHREFYVAIAVGSPIRTAGGGIGVAGLDLGVRGQASFVGYYPTIQRLAVLENNRENVESFARLLRFYQAYVVGGSVSSLQVDQIEQQLLDSRAQALQQEVLYQDSLDQFKIQLGVPTNLCIELDFGPLQPLKDQMQRLEGVEADYRSVLETLDKLEDEQETPPERLREILRRMFLESSLVKGTRFQREIEERYRKWRELAAGMDIPAGVLGDLAVMQFQAPFNPGGLPLSLASGPRRSMAARRLAELQSELDRLEDEEERYADEEKEFPKNLQDRKRELQLEISLGNMELALRFYDLKPWEREPLPAHRRLPPGDGPLCGSPGVRKSGADRRVDRTLAETSTGLPARRRSFGRRGVRGARPCGANGVNESSGFDECTGSSG